MLAEWQIVPPDPDRGRAGARALVTLTGSLDFSVLRLLAEHLELLAGRNVEQLTLDLHGVPYLDRAAADVISTAIRVVLPPGIRPAIRAPGWLADQLLPAASGHAG